MIDQSRLALWLHALESRHLASLTFREVARAVRALSAGYVQHRERLSRANAIDSAGKRAAYALYFSPLHFITVTHVVRALGLDGVAVRQLVDLGCGAGAAGAAWGVMLPQPPRVTAVDEQPWAMEEVAWTCAHWGITAHTVRRDLRRWSLPPSVQAIVVGWVLNELDEERRAQMQTRLFDAASTGTHVLILEPIATRVSPWWASWAAAAEAAGGRADEWRFEVALPDLLRRLDDATGLSHRQLTTRTLYLPGADAGRQADAASRRGTRRDRLRR